ncbi:hypothetical protein [Streptomyces sp. NPDC003717]|uniref:hypothetical protein n=1 Tax=Streptomyces sp. NPDC003717 TaxID=3154276 RepID=UPI0033A71D5E
MSGSLGFTFELGPDFDGPTQRGYQGPVGPFGQVRVYRPHVDLLDGPLRQVLLEGEGFPATEFMGGHGVLPSLDGGWMKVDETLVEIELKVRSLRKGSRSLEMRYRGRRYTYTSSGMSKEAELNRKGARVRLDRGRYLPESGGGTRVGEAGGDELDATDLAIALVLEEVDRSALTISGALLAVPMNFLFGRGRGESTE